MHPAIPLILTALTAAPQVDLTTLSGKTHSGTLQEITPDKVVVTADGESEEVPTSDLMEVKVKGDKAEFAEPPFRVVLSGPLSLSIDELTRDGETATLHAPGIGTLELPASSLSTVRLKTDDPRFDEPWQKLLERERKRDLLVIAKGQVLDFLEGTVGEITDKRVKFVLDGNEIPVARSKLFGILFARPVPPARKPVSEIQLVTGDRLPATAVSLDGDALSVKLPHGPQISIPVAAVSALDFSLGRIRYLSQIEPRAVDYTPMFDDEADRWLIRYRRDTNQEGDPISIKGQTFERGLWLHSKTEIVYPLRGEYQRLEGVIGIDDLVSLGDAHVVITGRKPNAETVELFEADIRKNDEPRKLELDVTNVIDLQILVDFGGGGYFGDHVVIGDARVIK